MIGTNKEINERLKTIGLKLGDSIAVCFGEEGLVKHSKTFDFNSNVEAFEVVGVYLDPEHRVETPVIVAKFKEEEVCEVSEEEDDAKAFLTTRKAYYSSCLSIEPAAYKTSLTEEINRRLATIGLKIGDEIELNVSEDGSTLEEGDYNPMQESEVRKVVGVSVSEDGERYVPVIDSIFRLGDKVADDEYEDSVRPCLVDIPFDSDKEALYIPLFDNDCYVKVITPEKKELATKDMKIGDLKKGDKIQFITRGRIGVVESIDTRHGYNSLYVLADDTGRSEFWNTLSNVRSVNGVLTKAGKAEAERGAKRGLKIGDMLVDGKSGIDMKEIVYFDRNGEPRDKSGKKIVGAKFEATVPITTTINNDQEITEKLATIGLKVGDSIEVALSHSHAHSPDPTSIISINASKKMKVKVIGYSEIKPGAIFPVILIQSNEGWEELGGTKIHSSFNLSRSNGMTARYIETQAYRKMSGEFTADEIEAAKKRALNQSFGVDFDDVVTFNSDYRYVVVGALVNGNPLLRRIFPQPETISEMKSTNGVVSLNGFPYVKPMDRIPIKDGLKAGDKIEFLNDDYGTAWKLSLVNGELWREPISKFRKELIRMSAGDYKNIISINGISTSVYTDAKPTPNKFKAEATAAGYRIAAHQSVSLTKTAIVNLLRAQGHSSDKIQSLASMLDTEFGRSIISMTIGYGMTAATDKYPKLGEFAKQCRIAGLTTMGNEIFDTVKEAVIDALQREPEEEAKIVEEDEVDDFLSSDMIWQDEKPSQVNLSLN